MNFSVSYQNFKNNLIKYKYALVILFCLLLVFILNFLSTVKLYNEGFYVYYDLTVVSDLYTSIVYQFKPFFQDNFTSNFLSGHFTPTLILFSPLFLIFNTQYAVLLINIISVLVALFFCYKIMNFFNITFIKNHHINIIPSFIFIILLFAFNKYSKANMASAHYESIGLMFMTIFFYTILTNKNILYIIISYLLALTSREDVGFFLFFQIISLFFISKTYFKPNKKIKILLYTMIILCPIYLLLTVKVIMPLFTISNDTEASKLYAQIFWKQWGNSWEEIIINMLKNYTQVIYDFFHGGFTNFNESFFYIGIFSPLQDIFINIPGVILYTADAKNAFDKKMLFWYNSAFLLPGMYITFIAGWFKICELLLKLFKKINKLNLYKPIILFISLLLSLIPITKYNNLMGHGNIYSPMNQKENKKILFNNLFNFLTTNNYKFNSISTDFNNIVYIASNKIKYTLNNYKLADIIIVMKNADEKILFTDEFKNINQFNDYLQLNNKYKLLYFNNNGYIYQAIR